MKQREASANQISQYQDYRIVKEVAPLVHKNNYVVIEDRNGETIYNGFGMPLENPQLLQTALVRFTLNVATGVITINLV